MLWGMRVEEGTQLGDYSHHKVTHTSGVQLEVVGRQDSDLF